VRYVFLDVPAPNHADHLPGPLPKHGRSAHAVNGASI
jgi:hypothetical protein